MKIKIDPIALDFMHTMTSVAKQISPEAVLYWARNKEKLEKLLEKKDFELLTQTSNNPYLLPSVAEKESKSLWFSKRIFEQHFRPEYAECIPKLLRETEPVNVYSYQLNAPLFRRELLEELGGEDAISEITFTYSQIVELVKRHATEKNINQLPRVLDFTQTNHFILRRPDRQFCLITIYSKKDCGYHKAWKGWIYKNFEGNGHLAGVLHIRQNL